MNLAKHDAETDMDMDMTPMIDVVFLLIIFFMVITDLTQQDLEDLELPLSQNAVPDKPDPDEWRPIINIPHTGKMIVKKKTYYDPENLNRAAPYKELRELLVEFAGKMEKEPLNPGSPDMAPSEPLLIRADMSTPFKYVQYVMAQAADPSVKIWKLELAVSTPEDGSEDE